MLEQMFACTVVGDADQVRRGLQSIIEATQADELILTSQVHEHAARRRSFEIVASVRADLHAVPPPEAAAAAR